VTGQPVNDLRDYQLAAIDAVRRAAAAGARRICLVMPTGAGKTRTCAELVRRAIERGGHALWLAHRAELVDQAAEALSALGLRVGAICDRATADPQPHARVQVATVQTLIARGERPRASLIIPDEAHHYAAETFAQLLADYPDAYVVGPTATPERGDGIGLGAVYQRVVVGARVSELVRLGHLVPAEVIAPRERLRSGQIAQRPVDAYLAHARGLRAVCFSGSVPIAAEHVEGFRAAGVRAALLTGETPWSDRRQLLADLRTGKLQVLCNVHVATEGFDVPAIGAIILARGFGSPGPYLQAVGRALRPATGKTSATILDLTGTTHVHGHPEDDRQYSLEGRGIRRDVDVGGAAQPYCRVCGAPIVSGTACAECGTLPREQKPPKVVGEPLVRYAAKRREAPDLRAATLRRWVHEGQARGYKPGWARAKYKAVYGSSPSIDVERMARGSALGAPEQVAAE
jgi:DNA repair protein RadD